MDGDEERKGESSEKQDILNKLLEEINIVKSKKNLYISRTDLLREQAYLIIYYFLYRIFMTVCNRLEVDTFITDKLKLKKKKDDKKCCLIA